MISLSVQVADGRAGRYDGHHQGQHAQFVTAETGDDRVPRGDVVTGQVTDAGPHADPEGRADRVQGQEPGKGHPGHAGDEPVGLAQPANEAGDRDDLASVPGEELLGPGNPVRREQHVPPEAGQQLAAAVAADEPADAVPRQRGRERDHGDGYDVQPARPRVDRGGDQHRLPRYRDAEVLQEQQQANRGVPVPVQVRRNRREQARQRGSRQAASALVSPMLGDGIALGEALPVRSLGMAVSSEWNFYTLVVTILLHDCSC
jgi:hypothetical protein